MFCLICMTTPFSFSEISPFRNIFSLTHLLLHLLLPHGTIFLLFPYLSSLLLMTLPSLLHLTWMNPFLQLPVPTSLHLHLLHLLFPSEPLLELNRILLTLRTLFGLLFLIINLSHQLAITLYLNICHIIICLILILLFLCLFCIMLNLKPLLRQVN